jgi:hypothetical protein
MVLSEWSSGEEASAFLNSREFQLFRGIQILLRGRPLVVFDEVRNRQTYVFT